jgi:hypothetical protein
VHPDKVNCLARQKDISTTAVEAVGITSYYTTKSELLGSKVEEGTGMARRVHSRWCVVPSLCLFVFLFSLQAKLELYGHGL